MEHLLHVNNLQVQFSTYAGIVRAVRELILKYTRGSGSPGRGIGMREERHRPVDYAFNSFASRRDYRRFDYV